ncbi:hypothetical protein [Sphingomonas sp. So64.6b]|uniref:hypothetical protein n=1 Tax=Sphingomonas sp. So64.6b TaxID=2997354 RepID=UPI0031F61611
MRISSAVQLAPIVFVLAMACGETKTDHGTLAKVEAEQRAAVEDKGELVCAQSGSTDFVRDCTVDRETTADGLVLTVRHPDGAFHRLLVTKDGRGLIAADGAEPAKVTIIDKDRIEVALGGDRYRLPATIKAAAATKP